VGDTKNAVRAARGAIEETPNDLDKRLLLYQIFAASGMNKELKEFLYNELKFKELKRREPANFGNRMNLIKLFNNSGATQTADSLVKAEVKELKLKTEDDKIGFGAKLLNYSLAQQAYNYTKELSDKDSSNTKYKELLVAILYKMGKFKEALTEAEKILAINPGDESAKQAKDALINIINSGDSVKVMQKKVESIKNP
jgi:tetratricopeptide (TPR) repeat protein